MDNLNQRIKNLVRNLATAFQFINIYSSSHTQAKNAIDKLYNEFKDIFEQIQEVDIGIAGEEIFVGKEVFLDLSSQLKDFIKKLKENKIEFIKFKKNLIKDELTNFLGILAHKAKDVEYKKLIVNLSTISVGKFEEDLGGTLEEAAKGVSFLNSLYNIYLKKSSSIIGDIVAKREIDASFLTEFISQISNTATEHKNLLSVITNIKKHDDYTFVHCLNVSTLTMFQAKNLGLPEKKIIKLGLAGFLHDIGKIAIDKLILEKKDSLSEEELLGIKNHVVFGSKILLKNANIDKISFIVSFQHHLGFNLNGYPKTKFLKEQDLASRLVSISDVYDALRSRRSYKESTSLERVYEVMMKESGRMFDPYLLELFFKNLGVWPVGTLVRLDTQEIGIVKENNPNDIFIPKVEIFYDSQENRLDESFIFDLTEKNSDGGFKKRITHHLSPDGEGQKFIAELFGELD